MRERERRERDCLFVFRRPQWNKHINNLVEQGLMEKAMSAARI